jgi:hypothetical protein
MTQFRRVGRNGRVLLVSGAFLALSLVGYGNTATAASPSRLAPAAGPRADGAVPASGRSAAVEDDVATGRAKSSGKPVVTGQPGDVGGCVLGVPTRIPPHSLVKPTKVGAGGPVVAPDPATGGGSAVGQSLQGVLHGSPVRTAIVAVPQLREGPNHGTGYVVTTSRSCSAPKPMPAVPVQNMPRGTAAPGPVGGPVATCALPPTRGVVSPEKPGPGASGGPGGELAEDQAVRGLPALCGQTYGDMPVLRHGITDGAGSPAPTRRMR